MSTSKLVLKIRCMCAVCKAHHRILVCLAMEDDIQYKTAQRVLGWHCNFPLTLETSRSALTLLLDLFNCGIILIYFTFRKHTVQLPLLLPILFMHMVDFWLKIQTRNAGSLFVTLISLHQWGGCFDMFGDSLYLYTVNCGAACYLPLHIPALAWCDCNWVR